ncbi:unknown [Clostridium sp. CAG:470]|nr:unknown [Clostridium sp. CAG:470]
MKNNKEKKIKNKEQRKYDKGQVFVKIMAGILAILMVLSIAASQIFALI